MNCKFCYSNHTVKYGIRRGIQYYLCRSCERTFSATDAPEGMRKPAQEIGTALSLFYDGLSLTAIQRQLQQIYSDTVETSTIYRWIMKYSEKADKLTTSYEANVSHTWVIDETVIELDGKNVWFWDILDDKARFLLASHFSYTRTIRDVETVLSKALSTALKPPRFIISDGMPAYPKGVKGVFEGDTHHLKIKGITHEINTNLVERFHGTLKQRTKIMRGLRNIQSARIILGGFVIYYNFLRPHMSLENSTPAEVAGIKVPFKNWEELIRYRT